MRLIDLDKICGIDCDNCRNIFICNFCDAPVVEQSEDCISREEAIRIAEQGQIQGYEWQFKELCNLPPVTPSYNSINTELEQTKAKGEWKNIYAESEGSNSWIEFKCPHCGYSFGMESGEYDWHYGDEIPWKYCPICGGSAEHKPYKAESEE